MGSNIQREIGARLRSLREDKGAKQKDLADVLGITPAAYGKLEAGDRGLSSEYCVQLADHYGVSCDYILRGIEAEFVGTYQQTGLSQAAIEALSNAYSELKRLETELEKSKDKFNYDSLCNKEQLAFEKSKLWIINAFIKDRVLWSELQPVAKQTATSTMRHITYMFREEFFPDDQLNHFYSESDEDYKTNINASRYVAGIAFGKFFSDLATNADFVLQGNVYETQGLASEYIRRGIESGFLHNSNSQPE